LALTPRVARVTINTTTSGRRCRTTSTARMLYLSGEKAEVYKGTLTTKGKRKYR